MLFTTIEFQIFFIVVSTLFYALGFFNKHRSALFLLTLASLFFYSYWNIKFLPLILVSIGCNLNFGWLLTYKIAKPKIRRAILIFAIFANLAFLGFFKYANWLILAVNSTGTHLPLINYALPLGISFYTFTQIAFIVDAYQRKTDDLNPLRYLLFVTYFPHLIAGPILHHKEMMNQFESKTLSKINLLNIQQGFILFAIGFMKKILIADSLASVVTKYYDTGVALDFWSSWISSLAYTFQLYFDFSGYTDMALGLSLMLNIRLPYNFNSPFKARSLSEFWRRWHITLSRFLRDYIYIPLGGNKYGARREYFAVIVTFALGGIWHGAGGHFLIWGLLNGLGIAIERAWHRKYPAKNNWVAWAMTFLFVNITLIFFRAHSVGDALNVLRGLVDVNSILTFGSSNIPTPDLAWIGSHLEWILFLPTQLAINLPYVALIIICFGTTFFGKNSQEIVASYSKTRLMPIMLVGYFFALAWSITKTEQIFLYFNF